MKQHMGAPRRRSRKGKDIMKRVFSVLCALLLTVAVLIPLMPHARAEYQEYTFYGTVGNTEYFIIHSNAYDEILEAKIFNGNVPGMWLEVSGGATMALAGEPTTDGEFTVFITMKTRGLGTVEYKVKVYINPAEPSGSGVPVVTKDPTAETVVEGENATFIAKATNVRQYCWQIAIADACIDVKDLPSYIGKGVKVSGWDSEKLVISNIPTELDGAYIWCQFVGAETSVDSKPAVLTVVPEEDAAPVVTKHPTNETVEEGEAAEFVARAKYAKEYSWQLVSPNGQVYEGDTVAKHFPGLKVEGYDTERLVLINIPLELNGFKIRCTFVAGYATNSNYAKLTVKEKPEEPTTEPTTAPTTEPTTEPTAAPTEKPTEAPTETPAQKPQQSKPTAGDTGKEQNKGGSSVNTLLIALVISASVVAVAAIAGGTILILKLSKRK